MDRGRYTLLRLALVLAALLGVLGASGAVPGAADFGASVVYAQDVDTQPDAEPDPPVTEGDSPSDVVVGEPPIVNEPVSVDPNVILWLGLLGVLSSLVTSGVSRAFPGVTDEAKLKRAASLAVVALLVAIVDVMIRGVFNSTNLVFSFLTIATAAVGFYKGWSESGTIAARLAGKPVH